MKMHEENKIEGKPISWSDGVLCEWSEFSYCEGKSFSLVEWASIGWCHCLRTVCCPTPSPSTSRARKSRWKRWKTVKIERKSVWLKERTWVAMCRHRKSIKHRRTWKSRRRTRNQCFGIRCGSRIRTSLQPIKVNFGNFCKLDQISVWSMEKNSRQRNGRASSCLKKIDVDVETKRKIGQQLSSIDCNCDCWMQKDILPSWMTHPNANVPLMRTTFDFFFTQIFIFRHVFSQWRLCTWRLSTKWVITARVQSIDVMYSEMTRS